MTIALKIQGSAGPVSTAWINTVHHGTTRGSSEGSRKGTPSSDCTLTAFKPSAHPQQDFFAVKLSISIHSTSMQS